MTDVKLRGPIFNAFKVQNELSDAVVNTVEDLAERGLREVRIQLYPGHGRETGDLWRSIRKRVRKRGKRRGTAVVDPKRAQRGVANWIEDGRWHRPSSFKGYGAFEHGRTVVERRAKAVANAHVRHAARKLN